MSEQSANYWAHYDATDSFGRRYLGKTKVLTIGSALNRGLWIEGDDSHANAPDKIFIPKHSITLIEAFIKAP